MTEKLGEGALQAMKEMDKAVVQFKVPMQPKMKKSQMKILSEEQYIEVSDQERFDSCYLISTNQILFSLLSSTQELGKIIQKDFFPDLEKLKAQNSYLEAVERNDMIKLRELHAKYSGSRPIEPVGCE